jgi:hypothetical protein
MHDTGESLARLKCAAFIIEALGLEDAPEALAPDLAPMRNEPHLRVYTVELESSDGPAAFLVYQYLLGVRMKGGGTCADIFKQDLEVLERAAELNTPGPRILAHATAEGEAYVLATTPDMYRRLTGAPDASLFEASLADLPPGAETARIRQEAPGELIDLIRRANDVAGSWLAAFDAEGRVNERLAFTEAEQALALFLLDNQSMNRLLGLLNLMVDLSEQEARRAMGERDYPLA